MVGPGSISSLPALRILYFGTPEFGVPALEVLLHSRHPVVVVVCQPDRPRGRGQRTSDGPVKQIARGRGLRVLQPERLSDPMFLADLAALSPDLGVVAAYGKILPDRVLEIPRLGLVNVHASLLPRYRGAAPVQRAVMAGEPETGVTIMRVVRALDAGPMLAQARRSIGPDETSAEVEQALARLGADLLLEVVEALPTGRVVEKRQEDSETTYAPRLRKDEGIIDWRARASVIHNQVRGLHPWPHAFTYLGGARLAVYRTTPLDAGRPEAMPGELLEATGDRLLVAAGEGSAVRILEVQPEGRRVMTAREFLAGRRLQAGTRLTLSPAG